MASEVKEIKDESLFEGIRVMSAPSKSLKGRRYLVGITCQCQGFKNRGRCRHLKLALAQILIEDAS